MNKTLYDEVVVKTTVQPQLLATGVAVTGTSVDTQGYQDALLVLSSGALGAGAITSLVAVVKGDDTISTATAIDTDIMSTANATLTLTAVNDIDGLKIPLDQFPRYITPVITFTGVAGGATLMGSCYIVLSGKNTPTPW